MKERLPDKLRNSEDAASHLMQAFKKGDPPHFQWAMMDIVVAWGGFEIVEKKAGISRGRVKLTLLDEAGIAKMMRLSKIMKALGVKLSLEPVGK